MRNKTLVEEYLGINFGEFQLRKTHDELEDLYQNFSILN